MRKALRRMRYVWSSAFLSVLFSAVHCLYYLYTQNMNQNNASARCLIHPLLAPILFFAALLFLFNQADRLADKSGGQSPVSTGKGASLGSWPVFFVVLTLFWLPYYLMCFPGSLFYDTGTSILHGLGIDTSNVNNPFLQNYIAGATYRLGAFLGNPKIGIGVYVFLQFFSYIALLSYALCRTAGNRALTILLTLLYALVPAFPIYAVCMGKDTNFAFSVLLFSCMTLELVRDGEAFFRHRAKAALLVVSVIMMGLLRNHAVFVPAIALLLYSLFADPGRALRKCSVAVCGIAVFISLLLPRMAGIPKTSVAESLSLPLQQTGFYYTKYRREIPDGEMEQLTSILSRETLEQYDNAIADPIKNQIQDISDRQLHEYFSVWLHQLTRHPFAYLKAAYLHTYAYYTPLAERGDVKPHAFVGFEIDQKVYDETELSPNTNKSLSLVKRIDAASLRIPLLSILCKIGIYTWLVIIGVVRLFQIRQTKYLVCFSSVIMVLLGCFLSPVNGYYRYAFPMILASPILFASVMQLAGEGSGEGGYARHAAAVRTALRRRHKK